MESTNLASSSQRVKSIFDLDDEDSDIEGPGEQFSLRKAPETVSKKTSTSGNTDTVMEEQLAPDDIRSSSPVIGKPMHEYKKSMDKEASSSYNASNMSKVKQKTPLKVEILDLNVSTAASVSQNIQDQSSDESDNDFPGFDIPEGGNISNSSIGDFTGFEVNSPLEVELNMSPVNDSSGYEVPSVCEEQRRGTIEEKFDIDTLNNDNKNCIPITSPSIQANDTKKLVDMPSSVHASDGTCAAESANGQVPLVKIEEPEMEYVEEDTGNAEQDGFFDMPSPNATSFATEAGSRIRIEDVYTDSDNDATDESLLQTALKNSMGNSQHLLAQMRLKASSRVDLEAMAAPFAQGWKREVVHRSSSFDNPEKRATADAYYFTPNNKKLRSIVEIEKYLSENHIHTLTTANFWFGRYPLGMDPSVERVRLSKAHGKRKLEQMASDGVLADKSVVPFKKRKVGLSSPSRAEASQSTTATSAPTSKNMDLLQASESSCVHPNPGDDACKSIAPDQLNAGVNVAADQSEGVISRDCEVFMLKLNSGVTRAQYPLYDAGTEAASSWNQSLCRIGRPLRLGSTPASHVIEPPREPWGARQPRLMAGPRIITPLVKGSEAEKTYHCTAYCNDVHAALPSLPCVKCRCLFHPQCIHLPYSLTQLIVNFTYKLMCPNCYLEAKRKASNVKVPPNPVKPYEPLSYEDDPSTSSYSDYSDTDEGVGSDLENLDPMNPSLLEVDLRPPTPTTPDYSLESYFPPPGTTEQQQRSMALEALQNLGTTEGAQRNKAAVGARPTLPKPQQQQQQLLKIKAYSSQAWANNNAKQQLSTGGSNVSTSASSASPHHPLLSSASSSTQQRNSRPQLLSGLSQQQQPQQQQQLLLSASQQLQLSMQQQLLQSGQHVLTQPELQQQHNIPAFLQNIINSYQMLEKMKVPENHESATSQKTPGFENYARDISLGYGVMKLVLQRLPPLHLLQAARTCVMWHDLALSSHMWRAVHFSHETCRITCWRSLAVFLDARHCVCLSVTGPLMALPQHQREKKNKKNAEPSPVRCTAPSTALETSLEQETVASVGLNGVQSPLSEVDMDPSPEVVSVGGESEGDHGEPMEIEEEEREEDDDVTPGAAAHAFEELDNDEHTANDGDHCAPTASGFDDSDAEKSARRRRRDTVMEDLESPSKDDSSSDSEDLDITAVSPSTSEGASASVLLTRAESNSMTRANVDGFNGSRSETCNLEKRYNPAEVQDDRKATFEPESIVRKGLDKKMEVENTERKIAHDSGIPKEIVDEENSNSSAFQSASKGVDFDEEYDKSTDVPAETVEVDISCEEQNIIIGESKECSRKQLNSFRLGEKDFDEKMVIDKAEECFANTGKNLVEDANSGKVHSSGEKADTLLEKDVNDLADADKPETSDVDAGTFYKKVEADVEMSDSTDLPSSLIADEVTDKNDKFIERDVETSDKCVITGHTKESLEGPVFESVATIKIDEASDMSIESHVESSLENQAVENSSETVVKSSEIINEGNRNTNLIHSTNSDQEAALKRDSPRPEVEIQEKLHENVTIVSLHSAVEGISGTVVSGTGEADMSNDKTVVTEPSSSGEKTSEKQMKHSPEVVVGPVEPSKVVSPVKLSEVVSLVQSSPEVVVSSIKSSLEIVVSPVKSSEVVISPVKLSPVTDTDEKNTTKITTIFTSDTDLERTHCLSNQKIEEVVNAEGESSSSDKSVISQERETVNFKKEDSPTLKIRETVIDNETSEPSGSKYGSVTIHSPASHCKQETLPSSCDVPPPSEDRELRLFGEDPAAPCFTVSEHDCTSESDSGEHVVTVTNVVKGEIHSQDSVANSPIDEKAKPDVSMMHDSTSPVGDTQERDIAPKIESHDEDIEPMDVDEAPTESQVLTSPRRPTLLLKRERTSKSPDVEITSSTFDHSGHAGEVVNEIKTMDSETSGDSVTALAEAIKGEIHGNSCDSIITAETSPLPERDLKRSPSLSDENFQDHFSDTCSPKNLDVENSSHIINDETQGSVLSDTDNTRDTSVAEITATKESFKSNCMAKESVTEPLSSTNEDFSTFTVTRNVTTVVKETSDPVKSTGFSDACSESDVEIEEAENFLTKRVHSEVQMETKKRTHGNRTADVDNEAEMQDGHQAFVERVVNVHLGEQKEGEDDVEVDERVHLVSGWRCASASIGSMTHLRELHLSDCQEGLLELLLPHCSRLTALRVSQLGHRPSNCIVRFDASLLLHAVNLEDLHLSGHFTFTSNFNFIKMRKLKKLGLVGAQLPRWPYLGTGLTHLYVSPVDRFTSDTWNNVAAMTDLVDLSLGEFSEGVADSSWYVSLSRLPAIRRLALTDCALGPRLLVLLKKFPQLNKIVLKPLSQHPTLSLPDQLWRVKHVWTLLPCSLRLLCDASDLTVAPSAKDPTPLPGLVFANSGSKATDQDGRQSASLQHVALSKLPQFFSRRSSTRAACFSFKILNDEETPLFPHHFCN
ncbi:Methyl-CpG DNA binding [Trinorchestia longiramus]|nr:Methyl-CpG DNA binding [Trinorchestia longiramus]